VLCLAQQQYSLLHAANLLTPDLITEFENLQQLVQEEKTEPGAETSRTPSLIREAPQAQHLCSELSECYLCSALSIDGITKAQLGPKGGLGLHIVGLCCCRRLDLWDCGLWHTERPSTNRSEFRGPFVSLSRASRVPWPCDPDHGKATEWPHAYSGDSSRA
jgi:hypothetical protein